MQLVSCVVCCFTSIVVIIVCFFGLLFVTHYRSFLPAPVRIQTAVPVHTTPEPKETSPPICWRCECDNVTRTLDCSNQNLTTWLTDHEWNQINNSSFEILLFDHNNFELVKVFPDIGIKKLVLSDNPIAKIERGAFQNLQALEILDLSHNNLTFKILRPEVFEGRYSPINYESIPKLKELNLGHNQLHSIHQDLFEHFPALETLILRGNDFKLIDKLTEVAIASILQLKTLDLSYLKIRSLPEYIFHAPRSLENLQLKGNLFKKIPIALMHAVNLKILNMDENPFEDFVGENVFPEIKTLENISLSHLPRLEKIGNGTFSGLTGLKNLDMQGNIHLSEIDPAAFSHVNYDRTELNYPLIEKLNLNNNNLTSLESNLLNRWDRITLDISENPWDCQCQNEWLIQDLYKIIRKENSTFARELGCHSPAELNGTKFESIYRDKNFLRCPVNDKNASHLVADGKLWLVIIIVLSISILMVLGVLLLYRRVCFVLLNSQRNDNRLVYYKGVERNENCKNEKLDGVLVK